MYRIFNIIGLIIVIGLISACGDEAYTTTNNTTTPPGSNIPGKTDPVPTGSSTAASVILSYSSPNLGSSSNNSITLMALVQDAKKVKLSNEAVSFSADGGALQVENGGLTNNAGFATAVLTTAGDPENKMITITATVGSISDEVNVKVTGTSISISGADSLVLGSTTTFTAFLKDSAGTGIPQQILAISSQNNNVITVPGSDFLTGNGGQLQFDVTITQPGDDNITIQALGATAVHSVSIFNDQFTFSLPDQVDLEIGLLHDVTVKWLSSNNPVSGTVFFSASRGDIVDTNGNPISSVTTDPLTGEASVKIQSTSAGPTTINAIALSGPSASLEREFVATTPSTISLQADKINIGPNGDQSTIFATVRDAQGNFVKNALVRFSISLGTSAGSLLNTTGITDRLGHVSTVFQSGNNTGNNGVEISAKLDDSSSFCTQTVPLPLCSTPTIISLTVAKTELFVKLGTANKLGQKDDITYAKPYNVVVTDSAGNAKSGVTVELTLVPTFYYIGYRKWSDVSSQWITIQNFKCKNEDLDFDGTIDIGEDTNLNGTLEPGNVSSVTTNVVTDSDGYGSLNITYAKMYAEWVDVRLTATTTVTGTESSDSVEFTLPILVDDVTKKNTVPGPVSKWGIFNTCGERARFSLDQPGIVSITSASPGTIDINWTNVPFAVSFNVYQSTTPQIDTLNTLTYQSMTNIPLSGGFIHTATGLTSGSKYYFVVTANIQEIPTDPIVEGPPSIEVNAIAQ